MTVLKGPSSNRFLACLLALTFVVSGCGTQPADSSPTPPPSPAVSPTPAPTPTATPIPPVPLEILWPANASALEDFVLQVSLPELSERDPEAQISAQLLDPAHQVWWESPLDPVGEGLYAARSVLHLPLEPAAGGWRLTVSVEAAVPVNGARTSLIEPAPIPLRDLEGQVPVGLHLSIPRVFTAGRYEGDQTAGARVWSYSGKEVGLWWAPGPAESLTLDTARVMVEATLLEQGVASIETVEAIEWGGMSGFRFVERWPDGLAEVRVLQGEDATLYVVRLRTQEGGEIPPLLWDILNSLRFEIAE